MYNNYTINLTDLLSVCKYGKRGKQGKPPKSLSGAGQPHQDRDEAWRRGGRRPVRGLLTLSVVRTKSDTSRAWDILRHLVIPSYSLDEMCLRCVCRVWRVCRVSSAAVLAPGVDMSLRHVVTDSWSFDNPSHASSLTTSLAKSLS